MTELTEEQVKLRERMAAADVAVIRATVRPVVTIISLVAWIIMWFMIFLDGGDWHDMPLPFTVLVFTCIIWYFGERTVAKAFAAFRGPNKVVNR